ncbi:MAG: class I SAM-dependent methyltransferase [Opitutaceae bacterium]|jgi:SAM-dependent methyltransferase|nr:class I SAM-dependent methyltransferase [Opitutaceae bacterium]
MTPRQTTAAPRKITADTVRADFNDPVAVVHYTRAAHKLGLWESERICIERIFPDKNARLLEAGCGAGRVTLGLWKLGYRRITAFDFAGELVGQARDLAARRGATGITIHHADATRLAGHPAFAPDAGAFDGALFMFNGLMQIPGRENRRAALAHLRALCRPGAPLLITTHDRDATVFERALWLPEAERWASGTQDPRLLEYGDRYFEDQNGRTFMHLPDRAEILAALAATGWEHRHDALRREIARESRAVREFSDECRFWHAVAAASPKPPQDGRHEGRPARGRARGRGRDGGNENE